MHINDNVCKSYAKVNLHLEVLNKRKDNYHNIFSLMANINLFDLLKLDEFDVSDNIQRDTQVEIEFLPGNYSEFLKNFPVEENLISRSVKYFLQKTGKSGYIKFSLEKNIPIGAGLAGGSSNGAAAVKLVSDRISFNIDEGLISSFSKVGADLPFCLTGGFQFCEGIGELLEPLNKKLSYYILVVNNGIAVNTAEAYKLLKREVSDDFFCFNDKKEEIRNSIINERVADFKNLFLNDFEKPVFSMHGELKVLKEKIVSMGAEFALMSGSGSTVFGLFADIHQAKIAETEMKRNSELVLLTEFI